MESKLNCGVPNTTRGDEDDEEEGVISRRVKRLVGGHPTAPVS